MASFWGFVLVVLSTAGITQFVTGSVLAAPFRAWVEEKSDGGKLAILVNCPWCSSFWISIPIVTSWWISWNPPGTCWFTIPAGIWATYYSVGFLSGHEHGTPATASE